jgi:hypothetical protein
MSPKKEANAPSTVPCAICKEPVRPEDYTSHIQSKHSTPPVYPGGYMQPTQSAMPATNAPRPYIGPLNAKDFSGGNYLKGSDVPQSITEVKVRIIGFVTVPGSRSPLVCQIEKTYERDLLPLNKTNIKQISAMIGDDLRALVGRMVVLMIYPVNNPSTGQPSRGLYVARVE